MNREPCTVNPTMLYMALTRGRLGTTVLCAPVEQEKPHVDFLVESVGDYERLMNAEA